MMRTLVVLVLAFFLAPCAHPEAWSSFRGPRATGVADDQSLPTSWDVHTGENIRFKTSVPGLGHSSPVVFGDRLFLTTAVGGRNESLTLGDEGGIDLVDDAEALSWRL
jgi:hypothetical protein